MAENRKTRSQRIPCDEKVKLWLALLGLMAFLQRKRAAPRVTSVPARVTKLPTTEIYGRVPGKPYRKRPLTVGFFVSIGWLEKAFAPPETVRDTVLSNAGILPGIGVPAVSVTNIEGGYAVRARYSDSQSAVTPPQVQKAIESIDPRLKGRISKVTVSRGK